MHVDITFYFTLVFGIIAPLIVLVLNIQKERNVIYFIIITHTSNFSIIYFASQSHLIHNLPNTPMLCLILDYWALLPVFIFCIGAALLGVVWMGVKLKQLTTENQEIAYYFVAFTLIFLSYVVAIQAIYILTCEYLTIVIKIGLVTLHHLNLIIIDDYSLQHVKNFHLGLEILTGLITLITFGVVYLLSGVNYKTLFKRIADKVLFQSNQKVWKDFIERVKQVFKRKP